MRFDSIIDGITEEKRITDNTYLITTSELYVVKLTKKDLSVCYNYLSSQNTESVLYPIKMGIFENQRYLLFKYNNYKSYPADKKIYDLKDALILMHQSTTVKKETKRNNFKFLYRLYKRLDYKFRVLDALISESELREEMDDYDWILLSKYSTFLDAKKELYRLQSKIHEIIDEHITIDYAINHGRPCLNHLVDNKLISLDESHFGCVVSDISRLYCSNDDLKIDWFNFIDEWLNMYGVEFYKLYFKFLTMYIFMINLNIDFNNHYISLSNYIQIHSKIQRVMITFKDY